MIKISAQVDKGVHSRWIENLSHLDVSKFGSRQTKTSLDDPETQIFYNQSNNN